VGRIAELAHAALRLCAQAPPPAVLQALRDVDAAECRLALARFDPAAQTRAQRVAASGAEPVVAAPDPESPLGDVVVREAVCSGARALVAASAALDAGQRDVAREALTTALVAAPLLPAVAQLVPRLLAEEPTVRLEDRLQRATSLLAGLPAQLEGVDVRGASAALAEVVAARERLARPLTIAIMGEFSAGKSTLVNALLGEDLAPMGVLPTTATINVFRWGRERGAQVHDRDGHVVDLRGDDVGSFLRGLDAEAAATIHHVEIRRTGVRLGDAAVVDTPGLNALDAWHERVAREFLDEADAVVWVFSATRGGVASEGTLLAALRASSRCVLGALNKADILDEAERGELTAYLREHLGEVLADVVPVSASRALQERLAGRFDDPDFARFEQALERSFLHRARDLKREVTIHRLAGALRRAIQGLEDTEAALLASAPPHDDEADARAIRGLVTHCGDELTRRICEGDDALLRECLSLGLLRAGNAAAGLEVPDPEVDRPDLAYLARFVRRGVVSAVAAALTTPAASGGAPGEPEDPRMTAARAELATWLLPWIEGHVAGAVDGARVAQWLERAAAGDRTELARRESLRLRLAAVAQACREHLDAGTPAWLRARASAARERASAPRRAAARLRLVERAALTVLLEAGAPT
jgi:GTPase SAR1 family protein